MLSFIIGSTSASVKYVMLTHICTPSWKSWYSASSTKDKALEIDPLCGPAWYNKGDVNFEKSRYEEAIKCYNEAIKIDPKKGDGWIKKALAFQKLRMLDEAIKCYNEAIKIDASCANCALTAWSNTAHFIN